MLRPLLYLIAAAALTLLAACTVSSPTQLVGPDEGATPLPAKFVVYGYKQGADDAYARTEEAPIGFALSGRAYVAGDNSMTLRFVPLDNNGYLLSVAGNEPGALYGTAWVKGQIVVIRMMLADDTDVALDKARAASPPALAADIGVGDDGLSVTRRATLDHLVSLMRKGTVPTSPLVAWVTEDPDAPTPTRIVKDADGWRSVARVPLPGVCRITLREYIGSMRATTTSALSQNLAAEIEKVKKNGEPLAVVSEAGDTEVYIVSRATYEAEDETAYLLSTEANRKALAEALEQYRDGKIVHVAGLK